MSHANTTTTTNNTNTNTTTIDAGPNGPCPILGRIPRRWEWAPFVGPLPEALAEFHTHASFAWVRVRAGLPWELVRI